MTVEQIRQAITTTLFSSWATATDISWPNQPYKEHGETWIRPVIRMGQSFIGELGTDGIGIRTGVLIISIFTPAGSGTKNGNAYADRIEAIFRRQDLSGVMFYEPYTEPIGLDDNGYYHTKVSINFETWIGE